MIKPLKVLHWQDLTLIIHLLLSCLVYIKFLVFDPLLCLEDHKQGEGVGQFRDRVSNLTEPTHSQFCILLFGRSYQESTFFLRFLFIIIFIFTVRGCFYEIQKILEGRSPII